MVRSGVSFCLWLGFVEVVNTFLYYTNTFTYLLEENHLSSGESMRTYYTYNLDTHVRRVDLFYQQEGLRNVRVSMLGEWTHGSPSSSSSSSCSILHCLFWCFFLVWLVESFGLW